MKRITKQQLETQIKEVSDRLGGCYGKIESMEKESRDFLKELMSIIEPNYLPRYDDKLTKQGVLNRVSQLKERVTTEGGLLPLIDHTIKEENAKLWYLVRVAMNDKSIEEPRDMASDKSRFTRPDFN